MNSVLTIFVSEFSPAGRRIPNYCSDHGQAAEGEGAGGGNDIQYKKEGVLKVALWSIYNRNILL